MEPVIELRNVSKSYQMDEFKVHVLNDVSLSVKKKEFVSIMGPSGSGKSTLLNMMGALDTPTTGKVFIDGTDLSKLNDTQTTRLRGKKIGFVFQTFNLYPTLTTIENVELPMIISEVGRDERRRRGIKLLELVGLKTRMNHLPSQMSGGERQRVAIARALANEPSFILADEPTGNLDTATGKDIMNLFVELNKKEGRTIVVVTHDPAIAAHSQKIIRIRDGKIE